jgi:hypothetical protein
MVEAQLWGGVVRTRRAHEAKIHEEPHLGGRGLCWVMSDGLFLHTGLLLGVIKAEGVGHEHHRCTIHTFW